MSKTKIFLSGTRFNLCDETLIPEKLAAILNFKLADLSQIILCFA